MRMSVRIGAVVVGLTALALLSGMTLGSSQEPPEQTVEFDVSATEARPGENVQATGRCLLGGSPTSDALIRLARVVGTSGNEPFDSSLRVTPDAEGRINTPFPIPADAPPDQYSISLTCLAGDQALGPVTRDLRVVPGATPRPADPAQPRPLEPRFTG